MPIEFTPQSDDIRTWVDAQYPEGDMVVYHTARCDYHSHGDECVGGCPIVPTPDPPRHAAQPLEEVLIAHMEARDELRAEAEALLRAMEDDVLPKGAVHWTGEFKYVNEDGETVDYDSMEGATWYQYRDNAGIEMWAAFVADSYMMSDGEW